MFKYDLTEPLVREVCRELDMPLETDWNAGMASLLQSVFPEPKQFRDATEFGTHYLRYNLLRKYGDRVPVASDPAGAALAAFLEAEENCASWNQSRGLSEENRRLDRGFPLNQSLEALFQRAKEKIRSVLGPFDWDEVAAKIRYTSGASSRLKRETGHPYFKYQGRPEVTPSCKMLMICDLWRTPLLRERFQDRSWYPGDWVSVVAGSRIVCVPKTWKIHRMVALEPEGNMRFQTGIGSCIRDRFKYRTGGSTAFGRYTTQDLNDQEPNARLAAVGSWSNQLATIDLSAASDSISLGLVEELLPSDWFDAICMTRSAYTKLPNGKWHKLEKVSSMGNGYTFELESLIFWALGSAVIDLLEPSDRRFRVYGDDIVISTEVAERLIQLLRYCGFDTNVEKTFVDGPFRESCGKHWFDGVDVSPFNIKQAICTEDRYYWFLNTYRSWLLRMGRTLKSFHRCLRIVKSTVYRFTGKDLCVVPPGFGFTAGLELEASRTRMFYSFRRGYVFTALLPKRAKRWKPNGYAAVLVSLESVGGSGVLRSETPSFAKLRGTGLEVLQGDVSYSRCTRATSVWVF